MVFEGAYMAAEETAETQFQLPGTAGSGQVTVAPSPCWEVLVTAPQAQGLWSARLCCQGYLTDSLLLS